MSHGANEMGQGEGTLTKAAGLVAERQAGLRPAQREARRADPGLQGKWAGAGGQAFFTLHQAWTEKQKVIVGALNEFEASLTSTEKDNISTDEAQSANYTRTAGRLGG